MNGKQYAPMRNNQDARFLLNAKIEVTPVEETKNGGFFTSLKQEMEEIDENIVAVAGNIGAGIRSGISNFGESIGQFSGSLESELQNHDLIFVSQLSALCIVVAVISIVIYYFKSSKSVNLQITHLILFLDKPIKNGGGVSFIEFFTSMFKRGKKDVPISL